MKASYSPCRSARKCSVPFGRFRMASRLMISVLAAARLGKSCEGVQVADVLLYHFGVICL